MSTDAHKIVKKAIALSQLNQQKMDIFVDVDNTVFKTNGMNYEDSTPMMENIERVNKLYDEGHRITYWTARGQKSGIDWTELTKRQLDECGAKYHDLKLTKPAFDVFIDDKVINARDWESGKWLNDFPQNF